MTLYKQRCTECGIVLSATSLPMLAKHMAEHAAWMLSPERARGE